MINTVIWDFNGTVLDDFNLCLSIINDMLARRGMSELSSDDYREHFDFPVIDYYRKVGFDFKVEPYPLLAAEYMAVYQPASFDCPLRQGLLEAVESLRRAGCRQILLSATQRDFLIRQVGHYNLGDCFDQIIGLGDIHGHSKLETAREWQRVREIAGNSLVLVGDTTHDYEVARALGCACVLLEGGHNSKKRLQATGTAVLENPGEIFARLSEWHPDRF